MLNLPAKILTILLLVGILLERLSFPTAKDATPFHDRIAAVVERIPMSFEGWDGRDVPLPAPARALLGEPIFLAREFEHHGRDLSGTLVIIHCRDTQDLAGHYPPNCYPSSGWSNSGEPEDVPVPIGGSFLPMKRYAFERRGVARIEELVVYDVFLIPGRSPVTSMGDVYRVASNHLYRPYGASQVQVILNGGWRREHEGAIVESLMRETKDLIETVSKGPAEERHAE